MLYHAIGFGRLAKILIMQCWEEKHVSNLQKWSVDLYCLQAILDHKVKDSCQ